MRMVKYRAAQAFIVLLGLALVGVIAWAAWDTGGWPALLGYLGFLALVCGFIAAVSVLADGKPYL